MKTDAWHAPRIGRITGSRVGAILGHSKWGDRGSVLREMVREALGAPREFAGNEATAYGEQQEPEAIAAYEMQADVTVSGTGPNAPFCVHRDLDWLGVRPDGFVDGAWLGTRPGLVNGEREGVIEVKCPYRSAYRSIEEHPDYMDQVQLILACTDAAWCDFIIWRPAQPLIIERILPNEDWLRSVLPDLRTFIDAYQSIIADKECSAPYLAPRDRTDADWRAAAYAYQHAARALADAQEAEASARQVLMDLAPTGASGCGVTLTRVERSGSIAYAKAIKALLPDADLTPYQGAPTTYYQVKI